ncbi:molybdenum cofactor guanylyltransferase [Plantactinospora siamensis]|uniref:Molybdenum cofactor guanylyltransferase n=1 Tax=Plantactinospora siamensis TaxID=555372 RepID=A0ABV6NQK1_9ACTN
MSGYGAVVLAGGAGRRLGGADKPAVSVGGRSMRDRVLAAVADAAPRIVVGPPAGLPADVLTVREQPAGGGPVAALAAGLARPELAGVAEVAVLAADLPLLTPEAVALLRRELRCGPADGVCYLDDAGRRQSLCAMWRVEPLRGAVSALARSRDGSLAGAPFRALLAALTVREVAWPGGGPPPWFDCDTEADVRRAEEWLNDDHG